MPVLDDAPTALRLRRLKLGQALFPMAIALGKSVSFLSMIERKILHRPLIEAEMTEYLRQEEARAREAKNGAKRVAR